MVTSSPMLDRLQQRVNDAAGPDIVANFWSIVQSNGGPLIEAGHRPGHVTVTFLWRDCPAHPVADVLVVLDSVTDRDRRRGDVSAHLMHRMPDTDIWALTYSLRADLRATYQFVPSHHRIDPRLDERRWRSLLGAAQPDQHNPRTFPSDHGARTASVLELPEVTPAHWAEERRDEPVTPGWQTQQAIPGPADSALRRVWIYEPACPEPPGGYDLLVLLDGQTWAREVQVKRTLDNLLADRVTSPTIAVMIDSVDRDTRAADFACSEQFTAYLTDEVVGWARAHWAIGDSNRCGIAGQGLGGLAAAYTGLVAPDVFGRVLAQSAPFWWRPGDPGAEVDAGMSEHPDAWFASQVRPAGQRSATFELQVGNCEWLLQEANLQVYESLLRAGHGVSYHEFSGGHEYLCWRAGLAEGLIRLAAR